MGRLFYYAINNYGRKKTLGLFRKVRVYVLRFISPLTISQLAHPELKPDEPAPPVDWSKVEQAYKELVSSAAVEDPEKKAASFADIIEGKVDLGDDVTPSALEDKLKAYHRRLSNTLASSPEGHAFFNGKYYPFDTVGFPTFTSPGDF